MKKYKLIKEYPGSPELETIVEKQIKSQTYYHIYNDRKFGVLSEHVEDSPEYWERLMDICFVVSERDYSQGNYTYFKEWTVYKIYEDNQRDSMLNYFETQEEADSFILKNKPCLSLNDVSLILGGLDKKRDIFLELKRTVKSKL